MAASDYVRALVRRWPLVLVLAVIGMGVGYLSSKPAPATPPVVVQNAPPSYAATTVLDLPAGSSDPTGYTLDSMAFFATTGPVAQMTATALHGAVSVADIRGSVRVAAKDPLSLLVVTATESTPALAATVANRFSEQLIAYFNAGLEASWHATLAADTRQISTLAKVVATLRAQPSSSIVQAEISQAESQYVSDSVSYQQLLAEGPNHTGLAVAQRATLSAVSIVSHSSSASAGAHHSLVPTSRKKLILLGGLVGLLVGLGAAIGLERLDTKIRSRDQIERLLGLPVLGELPSVRRSGRRRLVLLDDPLSAASESYRMLQTTLVATGAAVGGRRRQAILLTSPYELDGKDQVLANLAAAFSETGDSVGLLAMDSFDRSLPTLVVGGRRAGRRVVPDVAERLESAYASAEPEPLATVIEGVALVLDGVRPGIGSGRAQRHLRAVADARRDFDVVLVDTPPVLLTHDAGQLCPVVDSVVLMCPLGDVKAAEASRAAESLQRFGAPLDGVVLVAGETTWRRLARLLRSDGAQRRRPEYPAVSPPPRGDGAEAVSSPSGIRSPEVTHVPSPPARYPSGDPFAPPEGYAAPEAITAIELNDL